MAFGPWAAFLVCAGLAEAIGAMAGFGAATVFTPLAMLFLDAKVAIAVVAVFHLFGTCSRLLFFGRHIHWRTWAQFGLTGVVCSFLGAHIAARLPSAAVEVLFGGFLLLYVAGDLLLPGRLRLPAAPLTLMGGGAISGVVAGLLGTGGAVRAVCLLAFGLPQPAYLGTSAALALIVDATRLPVYLAEGLIPPAMGPVLVSLAPVAFAGAWIGQRLVRRLSVAGFHRFVLILLALIGLKLAVTGWHRLLVPGG
ncbi:MAG: hypothetical protein A3B78_02845 [Omnitrophica WOR_2 bacterium RIFCSPHIGHO2_02_FULL_67_20]|nr:MAG: hypothetical protein A3B78_02845 [Omnitrophica WOR_2 bacterium RIFCSPHIGHO2_02_FULL_67_20]